MVSKMWYLYINKYKHRYIRWQNRSEQISLHVLLSHLQECSFNSKCHGALGKVRAGLWTHIGQCCTTEKWLAYSHINNSVRGDPACKYFIRCYYRLTFWRAHAVWHAFWFVGILKSHLGVARRVAMKTRMLMRCQLRGLVVYREKLFWTQQKCRKLVGREVTNT
jgi:hypothetical protein